MHSRFEVCLGEHDRGKGDDMGSQAQANVNKNAIQVKKVYPLEMLAKFEAPPGSPPGPLDFRPCASTPPYMSLVNNLGRRLGIKEHLKWGKGQNKFQNFSSDL
jgi:hypothetical protein